MRSVTRWVKVRREAASSAAHDLPFGTRENAAVVHAEMQCRADLDGQQGGTCGSGTAGCRSRQASAVEHGDAACLRSSDKLRTDDRGLRRRCESTFCFNRGMEPEHRLHPRTDVFDNRVGGDVAVLLHAAGFGPDSVSAAEALADIPERTYRLRSGALAETSNVPVTPRHLVEAKRAQRGIPTALVLVHLQRRFRNTLWRSLDDNAKYQLPQDSTPFHESAWMLGQAWVLDGTRYLHPQFIEADTGELLLPDYGGADAQNFARSRALAQLASMVRFPGLGGPGSGAALESALIALHRPSAESQTSEDRGALREVALRQLGDILTASSAGTRPAPRLINGARQAEEYAAELMESFGYANVHLTPAGADGGIDVTSEEAVAQVKMEGVPTARPVLQAIYGNASHLGKEALVFSLAGFTRQAVQWAEASGVALFQFSHDGAIVPLSSAAEDLDHTLAGPPVAGPVDADSDDVETSTQPVGSTLVAQLSELAHLHQLGALTDEEFSSAKKLLLS